jgi:ppGpp synthetase/RelA/SpoT-type nucleotidyltranferase
MPNQQYESQKVLLRYSKKSIEKAARSIRHGCQDDDRDNAIDKIQNFREIHMYPLMLIKNHIARTAKKVSTSIVIARRLKRLPTIINKLERPTLDGHQNNAIKLIRMQDIGGCRAIVKDIPELLSLQKKLSKSKTIHKIIDSSDYLIPKPSGYGGVHLIYSCFHEDDTGNNWKKTKIEVQLRTKLQHAWATTLEIIDTLEKIELKTSLSGHSEWRRFFKISGTVVAYDEEALTLEESELNEIRSELNYLASELDVLEKLNRFTIGISVASQVSSKVPNKKDIGMCLVTLIKSDFLNPEYQDDNVVAFKVQTKQFMYSDSKAALAALNASEMDPEVALSVLLATSDARSLKKAYPNYFGDTFDFTKFINRHIDKFNK